MIFSFPSLVIAGEVNVEKLVQQQTNSTGNVRRVSTRVWAVNCGYDTQKLFNKVKTGVKMASQSFIALVLG